MITESGICELTDEPMIDLVNDTIMVSFSYTNIDTVPEEITEFVHNINSVDQCTLVVQCPLVSLLKSTIDYRRDSGWHNQIVPEDEIAFFRKLKEDLMLLVEEVDDVILMSNIVK